MESSPAQSRLELARENNFYVLLNGSVDTREEEGVLKEVLLEENSDSNNIGLQIEEDDIEERPDGDASGGSSEDI